MIEYLVKYKCGCNDKVHKMTTGMKNDNKKESYIEFKCIECKKKITSVKQETINGSS